MVPLYIKLSGDEIAISLWKECINVPEKFKREQLAPPPATTIVAVTNIKTSIIAVNNNQTVFAV